MEKVDGGHCPGVRTQTLYRRKSKRKHWRRSLNLNGKNLPLKGQATQIIIFLAEWLINASGMTYPVDGWLTRISWSRHGSLVLRRPFTWTPIQSSTSSNVAFRPRVEESAYSLSSQEDKGRTSRGLVPLASETVHFHGISVASMSTGNCPATCSDMRLFHS